MNYLAKAKILCASLKKYNPKAKFLLAISDLIPEFVYTENPEFDEILFTKNMSQIGNPEAFYFKHNITELCTAVKPFVASYIFEKHSAAKVVYLDPDIVVFNSLDNLETLLDEKSIALTPHQLQPEELDLYIRENEVLFLKRGIFNLGFFGVKNDLEGNAFLKWWASRLMHYCFDDNYCMYDYMLKYGYLGMFTDQKWIDFIPVYFNNYHIIKLPGYNASTWNLSHRLVTEKNGEHFVNGEPLYFFHFSGFDSGAHLNELEKHLSHYPHNAQVRKLSIWYQNALLKNGQKRYEKWKFAFSLYSNGTEILELDRKIFHMRKDVHLLFPNPYRTDVNMPYYNWVRGEYKEYYNKPNHATSTPHKWHRLSNSSIIRFLLPYSSKRRMAIKALLGILLKQYKY
jgi:hypothetical protein